MQHLSNYLELYQQWARLKTQIKTHIILIKKTILVRNKNMELNLQIWSVRKDLWFVRVMSKSYLQVSKAQIYQEWRKREEGGIIFKIICQLMKVMVNTIEESILVNNKGEIEVTTTPLIKLKEVLQNHHNISRSMTSIHLQSNWLYTNRIINNQNRWIWTPIVK